jgi:hypothetical protein
MAALPALIAATAWGPRLARLGRTPESVLAEHDGADSVTFAWEMQVFAMATVPDTCPA